MKAFHFPLERVLHWRRTQLQMERATMERIVAQRSELASAIATNRTSRTGAEAALISAGSIDSADLCTMAAWQARVNRLGVSLAARHKDADREASAQLVKVMEAQRQVKLLERMRESRQKEWTHEMEAEQERFAAEAWLGRWPAHSEDAS